MAYISTKYTIHAGPHGDDSGSIPDLIVKKGYVSKDSTPNIKDIVTFARAYQRIGFVVNVYTIGKERALFERYFQTSTTTVDLDEAKSEIIENVETWGINIIDMSMTGSRSLTSKLFDTILDIYERVNKKSGILLIILNKEMYRDYIEKYSTSKAFEAFGSVRKKNDVDKLEKIGKNYERSIEGLIEREKTILIGIEDRHDVLRKIERTLAKELNNMEKTIRDQADGNGKVPKEVRYALHELRLIHSRMEKIVTVLGPYQVRKPKRIDLIRKAENILVSNKKRMEDKGINLEFSPKSKRLVLLSDPNIIDTIMKEAMNNVLFSTSPEGKVKIDIDQDVIKGIPYAAIMMSQTIDTKEIMSMELPVDRNKRIERIFGKGIATGLYLLGTLTKEIGGTLKWKIHGKWLDTRIFLPLSYKA